MDDILKIVEELITKEENYNVQINVNDGNDDGMRELEKQFDKYDEIFRRIEIVEPILFDRIHLLKNITDTCVQCSIELNEGRNLLVDRNKELCKSMYLQKKKLFDKVKVKGGIEKMRLEESMNDWDYQVKRKNKIEFDEEIKKGLNDITGLNIGKKLFDSIEDDWNINNSLFGNNLEGNRDVAIVIEDDCQNVFGGFISQEIMVCDWHGDRKCCVFSLKRDGVLIPVKYRIKDTRYDFFINTEDFSCLFSFGAEDSTDQSSFYYRDICVDKKDSKNQYFYCEQYSFDYKGKLNALCGKRNFIPHRITAYQMI